MQADKIALTEARMREYLQERHAGFFSTFPYLKNGWSVTSLEKILQADVPAIVAEYPLTEEDIALLREVRENVCLISFGEAWAALAGRQIYPDFAVGDPGGDLAGLDQTALVLNAEEESAASGRHRGRQFFYWTRNAFIKYLHEAARKEMDPPYRHNRAELSPIPDAACGRAEWTARYLGASDVIFLGAGRQTDAEKIRALCPVKCRVKETVNELYPLFDETGWEILKGRVAALVEETREQADLAGRLVLLYVSLLRMACRETAYQDELESLMQEIGACMDQAGRWILLPYLLKVANEKEEFAAPPYAAARVNEIAKTAAEGAWQFQKIRLACDFFASSFQTLDLEQEMRREPVRERGGKSVLLLAGDSQYNVLPQFLDGLKRGFQALGFRAHADSELLFGSDGYSVYQNAVGYDYVLSINGVGLEVRKTAADGGFWYENGHTKTGVLFVDHPRRHADRIAKMGKGVRMFFPDRYWIDYVKKYEPSRPVPYYLPMAGATQEEGPCFLEKENKVVFFGSRRDLGALEREIDGSPLKGALWSVIEGLIANPHFTAEAMIAELGRRRNCEDVMESLMLHDFLLLTADEYVRSYFRQKTILALAKSGIPIDLYGWSDKEAAQYPNVSLKGQADFEEMLLTCRRSRFVLNVNPWTKDGAQERVFNAMLGGSVAVTDASEFLEREFADGENILFYRLNRIEALPERIQYYMDHPDEAERIARNGYRIAGERHTWEARAGAMMEMWQESAE